MRDGGSKVPRIKTLLEALQHIQKLADDDRHHVRWNDECEWLRTKLAEIGRLARMAKRLHKREMQAKLENPGGPDV